MTISVRLDPKLEETLRRHLRDRDLPLSEYVREAISEKLAREEPVLDRERFGYACVYREYLTDDARLVLANLRVAHDVITPRLYARPAIIAVPLEARTDLEITLLANLISLTPGSLSLDVSPDKSCMFVHGMFVDDPEAFRREIKDGFERRIGELLG